MFFWFRLGGYLMGAISLFSLGQRLTDFGLSAVFSDIVTFYRSVFHPIANAVNLTLRSALSVIGVSFPAIPEDIIIIYCLICAATYRTLIYRKTKYPHAASTAAMIFFSILWLSIPFVRFIGKKFCCVREHFAAVIYWFYYEDVFLEIGLVVLAFISMFGLNYYLA